jgi:hypothetical protein
MVLARRKRVDTKKKIITKMDILAVDSRKAEMDQGRKEENENTNSLGVPLSTSEQEIDVKSIGEEIIHLTSTRGTLTCNITFKSTSETCIYPFEESKRKH